MPILKIYPKNWKSEICPRILERANNCCEFCGLLNYTHGYRDKKGNFYSLKQVFDDFDTTGYDYFKHELSNCVDEQGFAKKSIKIILMVTHLDHDITNNSDDNLKALCQSCYLNYNLEHHKKNRKENRLKNKKQLTFNF
jgi:hypothetical protein